MSESETVQWRRAMEAESRKQTEFLRQASYKMDKFYGDLRSIKCTSEFMKGFICGLIMCGLLIALVSTARADELQCISEDQALATVHVKADTMMAVPEFKYNRIGTYNAKKLKAFIPSSRMMVAFSKQYPTVVFVVYMAGQCATGIVVMERQEYIDLAGMDA